MKTVYLAAALGGVAVLGGAGYFYLDHQFQAVAQEQIATFNADPDMKVRIEYGSLDTSVWNKSINFRNVSLIRKADDVKTGSVEEAHVTLGDLGAGKASIKHLSVAKATMGETGGLVSLDRLVVEDADIMTGLAAFEETVKTHWPFRLVEVQGFKVDMATPAPQSVALGTYRFETSDNGRQLVQLLIKDVGFEFPAQQVGAKLAKFEIKGGDLGLFLDAVAESLETGDNPAAVNLAIQQKIMAQSLNYMGLDGLELSGLSVKAPNGLDLSLKSIRVDDIVRHGAYVSGVHASIEDFAVRNLQQISPQAAMFLSLAELNDFVLNMDARNSFDASTKRLTGKSRLTMDGLMDMSSDVLMTDVDIEKMAAALQAMQMKQLELQAADREPLTPEQEMAEMKDMLIAAYVGYYKDLAVDLTLKDQGLIRRGLAIYAAMNGMAPEDLRPMLAEGIIGNLAMALGAGAPENLADVIGAYLDEPSAPFRLSVKNKQPVTTETVAMLDATNWPDLIGLSLEQVADGSAASR